MSKRHRIKAELERIAKLPLNYNHRLFSNRLNIRANLRGARTNDNFTPGAVLGSATNFDPTQPIRTASGSLRSSFVRWLSRQWARKPPPKASPAPNVSTTVIFGASTWVSPL